MLAKIPFMKFLELSSPYFFAISNPSFIATLYGIFLYLISYIASFNILKSILDSLSNFQSAFRFFSISSFISSSFLFIPLTTSLMCSQIWEVQKLLMVIAVCVTY